MDYESLEQLEQEFKAGNFNWPDEITVKGVPFTFGTTSSHSMNDIMKHNYKSMVIYTFNDARDKENADAAGLKKWIIFLWGFTKKSRIVPYAVRNMTKARASVGPITEMDADDNDIGSVVEVKITNLPGSKPLQGKVDTGADISSLHADAFKINRSNGTVTFKCPELSQNELTMQLVDQQAVKTADSGVEYRPVIELNVKINGKMLNGVNFNLNDRGKMTYPILVGKNALIQGKFKINPSLDESVDWEALQEEFKDIEEPELEFDDIMSLMKEAFDKIDNNTKKD